MKKYTKQYYGVDVMVYEYKAKEALLKDIHLDEVVNFSDRQYLVYDKGIFNIPEGREKQSLMGYGQTGELTYAVVADGLNVKQMTNILLDMKSNYIEIVPVELDIKETVAEKIIAETIDVDGITTTWLGGPDQIITSGTIDGAKIIKTINEVEETETVDAEVNLEKAITKADIEQAKPKKKKKK